MVFFWGGGDDASNSPPYGVPTTDVSSFNIVQNQPPSIISHPLHNTQSLSVENTLPLIRWNLDKSYMSYLLERGLLAVDTVVLKSSAFSLDLVTQVARDKLWNDVVVKPSVGSCSEFCYKLSLQVTVVELMMMIGDYVTRYQTDKIPFHIKCYVLQSSFKKYD